MLIAAGGLNFIDPLPILLEEESDTKSIEWEDNSSNSSISGSASSRKRTREDEGTSKRSPSLGRGESLGVATNTDALGELEESIAAMISNNTRYL
jgi:hypothetical protein